MMNTPLGNDRRSALLAVAVSVALTGCAVGPKHFAPEPVKLANAAQWQAPVPAATSAVNAADFWRGWNDPVLLSLIESAMKNATSLEVAEARIAQARAVAGIARGGSLPVANANASLSRGNQGQGTASTFAGAIQAAWELDLFGANRRSRDAADARIQARERDLADARTSLASDVATIYVNLRVNEALLGGFERDVVSRTETERLTLLKTQAGFEAPANAALATAAAAEARTRVAAQRAEIALAVKALVMISAMPESEIQSALQPRFARLSTPQNLAFSPITANVLNNRADLASLERELAAAIAEIGAAEADRYPKISLTGSIGYSALRAYGQTGDGATWGFGPSISIPLFDAGRRAASVELAKARHAELTAAYRATALRAVKEVEDALTKIHAAQAREADQRTMVANYEAFAKAAQARLSAGIGSVLELEESRRAVLGAQVGLLNLERERITAWIALYRAVGGDWMPASTGALSTQPVSAAAS